MWASIWKRARRHFRDRCRRPIELYQRAVEAALGEGFTSSARSGRWKTPSRTPSPAMRRRPPGDRRRARAQPRQLHAGASGTGPRTLQQRRSIAPCRRAPRALLERDVDDAASLAGNRGGACGPDSGDFARAIELLEPVKPYDHAPAAEFWPAYLRGVAYLGLKDGQRRRAQFQSIVDQRGAGADISAYALAQLGAARAAHSQETMTGPAQRTKRSSPSGAARTMFDCSTKAGASTLACSSTLVT